MDHYVVLIPHQHFPGHELQEAEDEQQVSRRHRLRFMQPDHLMSGSEEILPPLRDGRVLPTPRVGQDRNSHPRLDSCAMVDSTLYVGRCIMRKCIRAKYSPIIPSANSCPPEKMAITEARKGKPATLVPC